MKYVRSQLYQDPQVYPESAMKEIGPSLLSPIKRVVSKEKLQPVHAQTLNTIEMPMQVSNFLDQTENSSDG